MHDDGLRARLKRRVAGCCQDIPGIVADIAELPLGEEVARHQALGDKTRLTLVAILAREPGLCGCELQAATGVSHATISHHMRRLAEAGLVEGERRGKWVHYTLSDDGRRFAP